MTTQQIKAIPSREGVSTFTHGCITEVAVDDEPAAMALVTADSFGAVHVHFQVRGGHVPVAVRPILVEAVFERPDVTGRHRLLVTVPLGDTQLLDDVRRRCAVTSVRAAGASCLVDGDLGT